MQKNKINDYKLKERECLRLDPKIREHKQRQIKKLQKSNENRSKINNFECERIYDWKTDWSWEAICKIQSHLQSKIPFAFLWMLRIRWATRRKASTSWPWPQSFQRLIPWYLWDFTFLGPAFFFILENLSWTHFNSRIFGVQHGFRNTLAVFEVLTFSA